MTRKHRLVAVSNRVGPVKGATAAGGLAVGLVEAPRRHEVLIASVADPRLAEMAQARGTVDGVYEAAAAEQTRTERRRTAQHLSRHSVTVVDAAPADLPPALADAYLALKASGRL